MIKKLLIINSVINSGSTGRISESIGIVANKNGFDTFVAYGRKSNKSSLKTYRIGNSFSNLIHLIFSRFLDNQGLLSILPTLNLIKYIKKLNPDIINLHNIHGYYLNHNILFKYLNTTSIKICWTFHDCWPFTGHCIYFDHVQCDKWETLCNKCPQTHTYPKSFVLDRSKNNFNEKKLLFSNNNNLTIICVSNWMCNLVNKSFLKNTSKTVIHNGINLKIFRPLNKFNLKLKKINSKKFTILGVAYQWTSRKGLTDFIELSQRLTSNFQIILVGLSTKQIKNLPNNIIGITKTENISELVQLYSYSDVFVNPTYEDNYPTTNLESMACGTPVITYSTGGSIESVCDDTGFVIKKGDINSLTDTLIKLRTNFEKNNFSKKCRLRAEKYFDENITYENYINTFKTTLNAKKNYKSI